MKITLNPHLSLNNECRSFYWSSWEEQQLLFSYHKMPRKPDTFLWTHDEKEAREFLNFILCRIKRMWTCSTHLHCWTYLLIIIHLYEFLHLITTLTLLGVLSICHSMWVSPSEVCKWLNMFTVVCALLGFLSNVCNLTIILTMNSYSLKIFHKKGNMKIIKFT